MTSVPHDDEVPYHHTLGLELTEATPEASWSLVGLDLRYKGSTVGIHVNYHGPARGEDVVAVASTLTRTDESFLNRVVVIGRTSGRTVATGSVTSRIVPT